MQLNLRRANFQKSNQTNGSGSKKLTGRSACKRMLWPVWPAVAETSYSYRSQELKPETLVNAYHGARFET